MNPPPVTDDDFDDDWSDEVDDGEAETLICPNCRAEVYEETEQCPACGDWITPVYPGGSSRWIWTVAVVLVIAGLLMAVIL